MWSFLIVFFFNSIFNNFFFFFSFAYFLSLVFFDFSWPNMFSYFMNLDQIKFLLVVLTFLIMMFTVLENYSNKWLLKILIILKFFLVMTFLVNELILFFMFFELSLIPTAYLIFSWGVQPERLSASYYFFLYAIVGSFPLLSKIMYLSSMLGEMKFSLMFKNNKYLIVFEHKILIVFFWMFSFLMKLPIYGFHLWLPKAHVEAPVYGSMILAAVLLKLGSYGLLRLTYFNLMVNSKFLFWILISLILVGIITFRSTDIKSLIAYSSISHMALTMFLYYILKFYSFFSLMFILMGHGFISSSLFQSFKMYYQVSNSRKIFLNKGFKKVSSFLYFMFFCNLCLKASFPLNLTFFSEVIISMTMFYLKNFSVCFFFFSVFLVGLYNINLFLITNQGKKISSLKNSFKNLFLIFMSFLHLGMKFFLVYFSFKFF